jgi:maltose/moltooligosaccharide transporter
VNRKPELSFWQIWNMCFGFLGIQFGFALQNANVSRIFQTLGASMDQIPVLWIAAPLTGLIVQPIVGHCSDRTWTRLGRRRPYFLWGALIAATALLLMPNSTVLWVAAGVLWILDASINVSMEPFRAFVGDQLPPQQQAAGYSMQSFFIGAGAVVASLLPWLLAKLGVANTAAAGAIPATVHWAFYLGAVVLFGAVAWTVVRTREYPPAALDAFARQQALPPRAHARPSRIGIACWLLAGIALAAWTWYAGLKQELYILAIALFAYGIALLILARSRGHGAFVQIMADLHAMPEAMRRLALVQFFSWFGLFAMWIYATPAVTSVQFGSSDPTSAAYNTGANWVGVLFAAYNGFAALAAIAIPKMVACIGLRWSHLLNLWIGAAALFSFLVIRDPDWLLASMVGIGIAWASILSLPYAMLCDGLPVRKLGVYMGIFNFFIVIPQLLAASVLGTLLKAWFGDRPIYALAIGGISFLIGGLSVLRVPDPQAQGRRSWST